MLNLAHLIASPQGSPQNAIPNGTDGLGSEGIFGQTSEFHEALEGALDEFGQGPEQDEGKTDDGAMVISPFLMMAIPVFPAMQPNELPVTGTLGSGTSSTGIGGLNGVQGIPTGGTVGFGLESQKTDAAGNALTALAGPMANTPGLGAGIPMTTMGEAVVPSTPGLLTGTQAGTQTGASGGLGTSTTSNPLQGAPLFAATSPSPLSPAATSALFAKTEGALPSANALTAAPGTPEAGLSNAISSQGGSSGQGALDNLVARLDPSLSGSSPSPVREVGGTVSVNPAAVLGSVGSSPKALGPDAGTSATTGGDRLSILSQANVQVFQTAMAATRPGPAAKRNEGALSTNLDGTSTPLFGPLASSTTAGSGTPLAAAPAPTSSDSSTNTLEGMAPTSASVEMPEVRINPRFDRRSQAFADLREAEGTNASPETGSTTLPARAGLEGVSASNDEKAGAFASAEAAVEGAPSHHGNHAHNGLDGRGTDPARPLPSATQEANNVSGTEGLREVSESSRESAATAAVSQMSLRRGIRASADIPELGRVNVSAEGDAKAVTIQINAENSATSSLLAASADRIVEDARTASVTIARVDVGQSQMDMSSRSSSQDAPKDNTSSSASRENDPRQAANPSTPFAGTAAHRRVRFVI